MVNPAKTADDSCERVSQSAAEWGENQSGQTQLENPTVSRKPKQTTQLSRFPWTTQTQWPGEIFGHNRSKSECFPSSKTCCDSLDFSSWIRGMFSKFLYSDVGKFHEVFELQPVTPQTPPVHL